MVDDGRRSPLSGAGESIVFRVSDADMDAFRRLSSDTNPMHSDAEFARARGFPDVLVYGGLIIARISQLLGTRLPGPGCVWRSLSLRFRSPLRVGESAELRATVRHANEDLGVVELALRVEASGRLVAEGEASAQLATVREVSRV